MSNAVAFEIMDPRVSTTIQNTFDLMEVAEDELGKRETKTPFLALLPPTSLSDFSDYVYRMHVRELIERDGNKVIAATSAEMCAEFSRMSLIGPLNHSAAWLYWKHFNQIFPDKMDEPYADDWDKGELGEDIERQVSWRVSSARESQYDRELRLTLYDLTKQARRGKVSAGSADKE